MKKPILDVCCGSRMFYFNKKNPLVEYCDNRKENHILCDNRKLNVSPDTVCDFRNLPFEDESKNLIVFDPPHMTSLGKKSWMAKKYGVLNPTWKTDIAAGFGECFRVLKVGGTLVFKWNETDIPLKEILRLTENKPVLGHISGKRSNTHWVLFYKCGAS